MRHTLRVLIPFALCLVAKPGAAQSRLRLEDRDFGGQARLPALSLCDLQMRVAQGERWSVQVEGVYLDGSDGHYLVAPVCAGLGTRVEFGLKTHRK
jgi:hypothetical protein